MESIHSQRRNFLQTMGGAAGAAWLNAQWPAMAAAAQHAHQAANASQPVAFEVLTLDQAKDVIAIAARIIPTDDEPGATDAGVVYFIDRALKTFASDERATYEAGLKNLNQLTSQTFPGATRFSAASKEQQDKLLSELSKDQPKPSRGRRSVGDNATSFFQVIWFHTLAGFLVDPEGGGNRDYVGWKVIGRDPAHVFSPPFGYYDKDYPGWQAAMAAETEKK
jgi:gluconate 2-dehydrogenase gamma chain